VSSIIHTPWFVLPPSEEWFYKQKDPAYKTLPPLSPLCDEINDLTQIQVIYPDPGSVIYVPYELGGQRGKVVFEAAHRNPESTIFWSIDEEYITETSYFHQISVVPEEGEHVLTLTDEKGNNCKLKFEVVDR
jgi:penicillin-binding protein 1C